MTKEQVIEQIKQNGLVAVIRANSPEHAVEMTEKCRKGGVTSIEITFTTPRANRAIEMVCDTYGDELLVGAGTVLDDITARIAILAGAKFIVSPHFDADIAKLCNRYRVAYMAGVLTVTEAVRAMEAGVDVLKMFPGELHGPAFIKALHGPLPHAQIMPTGGVSVANAGEWIKAGAVALGAGGCLTKGDVEKNAKDLMDQIRAAREEMAK